MTITLELTQEEEVRLQQRANRAGLTPEEYLRRSLAPKSRAVRNAGSRMVDSQYRTALEQSYPVIAPDQRPSTGASLLKYAGTWAGDDLQSRLDAAYDTRSEAGF